MKHLFAQFILACAAVISAIASPFTRQRHALANTVTIGQEDVETHCGGRNYKVDNTVSSRDLLFKQGTDASHIDICGVGDSPLGTVDNKTLVAEDYATLLPIGNDETRRMVASEAIAVGDDIYTAANGQVQNEPATAGTYFKVGRALTAALAAGDTIEVETCKPVKLTVIALLGNVNSEISALTFSSTPTQAEANALRDKCEELADDVRALGAALAAVGYVKPLQS